MSFRHVATPLAPRLRVLKPISPLCKPWYRASHSLLDPNKELTPDEIEAEKEHHRLLAELEIRDQELLTLIEGGLGTIISNTHRAVKVARDLRPASTDPARTPPGIPPYALLRDQDDVEDVGKKFVAAARELRLHMRDLRAEPYSDRSQSAHEEWVQTMLTWSEEEKREKLNDMRLQLHVDKNRLSASVKKLADFAQRPKGNGAERQVSEDAAGGRKRGGRRSGRREREEKVMDKSNTVEEADVAFDPDDLFAVQKRIDEARRRPVQRNGS